jgi:3-oxo-5-alpha-steroid 4-dehydrogenase 1
MESAFANLAKIAALIGVTSEALLLDAFAYCMIATAVVTFIALHYTVAPYGKYAGGAPWYYGPPVNARVAWILQEAPSFLGALTCWYVAARDPSRTVALTSLNPVTLLLSLYLFHYANRSFVYPLRIVGGKPTPLIIMLLALVFCFYNGYLQGQHLAMYNTSTRWEDLLSLRVVVGVLIWISGLAINWHADATLRSLRKPGESGYKIPRGGAFEYVSGANFFGEIVEWTGFAIAAWSLPAFAYAFFTFCNIGPRGAQHHKWYRSHFKDYPKERCAVLPYIW